MIVTAERVSEKQIFLTNPQQSDYLEEWRDASDEKAQIERPKKRGRLRAMKDYLISNHPRLTLIGRTIQQSGLNSEYSFKNPKSFKLVSKPRKLDQF